MTATGANLFARATSSIATSRSHQQAGLAIAVFAFRRKGDHALAVRRELVSMEPSIDGLPTTEPVTRFTNRFKDVQG
jgi:hypothetical protein